MSFLRTALMVLCATTLSSAELVFTVVGDYKFCQSQLSVNNETFRIWVYTPITDIALNTCIIVPPAGTPLVYGMNLSDGDKDEQLPYVRKGYCVVAFDIIGGLPDHATAAQQLHGITSFFNSAMGVEQIPAIITFIKEHMKNIDPKAIYVAGHSSAATLALQASQCDYGLAGVIAYCPVVDIVKRIGAKAMPLIIKNAPRYKDGLGQINPMTNYKNTKCKVFLFGTTDDQNVSFAEIDQFAKVCAEEKLQVTFVRGTGDHYQSMIDQGIPAALQWLAK